ncbi:MAG TPA: hypothetical protein PLW86_03580 [Rhodocyclaceae bacterium]|nr:hypothetical protein [Rhodocyclaceae bacterium]
MKFLALTMAAALAAIASTACYADGFVWEVTAPNFKISLPNLPAMKLETHPLNAAQPHLRLLGSEGPYTISVLTPTADAGMTAQDCANSTIRSLPRRPGVPALDTIFKGRINDKTFVAIYASSLDKFVQLHAHIMSAASGTHCIEVHASKISTSKDDVEPWFTGFTKSNIEPQ